MKRAIARHREQQRSGGATSTPFTLASSGGLAKHWGGTPAPSWDAWWLGVQGGNDPTNSML